MFNNTITPTLVTFKDWTAQKNFPGERQAVVPKNSCLRVKPFHLNWLACGLIKCHFIFPIHFGFTCKPPIPTNPLRTKKLEIYVYDMKWKFWRLIFPQNVLEIWLQDWCCPSKLVEWFTGLRWMSFPVCEWPGKRKLILHSRVMLRSWEAWVE